MEAVLLRRVLRDAAYNARDGSRDQDPDSNFGSRLFRPCFRRLGVGLAYSDFDPLARFPRLPLLVTARPRQSSTIPVLVLVMAVR